MLRQNFLPQGSRWYCPAGPRLRQALFRLLSPPQRHCRARTVASSVGHPPGHPKEASLLGSRPPQSCLQPSGQYHAHHGQSSFQAPRGGRGRWTCLPGIAGELKTAHLWGQVPALQLKRSAFGQITLSVVLPLSSSPHRVDSRQ